MKSAAEPVAPDTTRREIVWSHGRAELQSLGGMLAPVVFEAPGRRPFAPLQVAPWADEPGHAALPGILRRLRGEWPCVPFGRCDRPGDLPSAWSPLDPGDDWGHGYASHHAWSWLPEPDPLALTLQIEPPASSPVSRLRRQVRAVDGAPALDIRLDITTRAACVLPVALHPTLRLDAGRVQLDIAHAGPGLTYPVPAEPSSRLQPDTPFTRLDAAPLAGGGTVDLSRYPQPADSEELLQLTQVSGPVRAHYLDQGWTLTLDWDRTQLPDLMLWVSHRGRPQPPWNSRHWALGLEPVNGAFDLGRVARAPADHPLAGRAGLAFEAGQTRTLHYRLSAEPMTAQVST